MSILRNLPSTAIILVLFISTVSASGEPLKTGSGTRAFPGAEGFGAHTPGGRGGAVLFVTNLDDYVPGKEPAIEGSLRAACSAAGPRTVIFRVSGTIALKTWIKIREPFLTLAGQTAPGGGICIKNYGVTLYTHDVIMRYLRIRPGDGIGRELAKEGKSWDTDAISIASPSRDIIIDHCSMSWANDEVCSVSGEGITNVTVQWSIISESLNHSTHYKGDHGYGSLLRCNGALSFHHNLYAFHKSRSPRPGTYPDDGSKGVILLDFRNNVMHRGGSGYSAADPVRMNFIANYHPDTPFKASDTCTYFAEDNRGVFSGGKQLPQAHPVAVVRTQSAEEARKSVFDSAGATLPKRDLVDQRVMELVRTGKGALIDSADDVGGWPALESVSPPDDTDKDGMPDAWETKYGFDPRSPSDNVQDKDQDGYTNLEEFLNGTSPGVKDE